MKRGNDTVAEAEQRYRARAERQAQYEDEAQKRIDALVAGLPVAWSIDTGCPKCGSESRKRKFDRHSFSDPDYQARLANTISQLGELIGPSRDVSVVKDVLTVSCATCGYVLGREKTLDHSD